MQVELKPIDTKTVVNFENLPLSNMVASKKAGRPIYDDHEVCRIRFPGNKATAGVYPAHEVFKQGPDQFGFIGDITYAMEYNSQYMAFKTGVTQTQSGTPLSELPFLTAGKRLELKAMNIHTAEVLAALDSNALKALGPGGRDWKNKAITWLEESAQAAGKTQLNEAMAEQNATIEVLKAQIAEMRREKGDEVVDDGDKGDDEDEDDRKGDPDNGSEFNDWDTPTILAWIKDASPTTQIFPSWKRAKVLSVADEIAAARK